MDPLYMQFRLSSGSPWEWLRVRLAPGRRAEYTGVRVRDRRKICRRFPVFFRFALQPALDSCSRPFTGKVWHIDWFAHGILRYELNLAIAPHGGQHHELESGGRKMEASEGLGKAEVGETHR